MWRCHTWAVANEVLFHFSEDPTIARFVPHVPRTNPEQAPAVWAIDAEHAPLYWFPRDCPRVTAWPRNEEEAIDFRQAFATDAPRVHAIELGWLERMRTTELHRYELDAGAFTLWESASGQWITHTDVEPLSITPVGDLLDAHAAAGIELRLVPSLWPLRDLMMSDRWDYSLVRMSNAISAPSGSSRGSR